MTGAELKPDFKFKLGTPYIALTIEPWGVYSEEFGENWPHYNGTALHKYLQSLDVYVIPS